MFGLLRGPISVNKVKQMSEPKKEKEHEVVYSHLADRTSEPQSEPQSKPLLGFPAKIVKGSLLDPDLLLRHLPGAGKSVYGRGSPGAGKTAAEGSKLIREMFEEEYKRREKKRRFYEKWVNDPIWRR